MQIILVERALRPGYSSFRIRYLCLREDEELKIWPRTTTIAGLKTFFCNSCKERGTFAAAFKLDHKSVTLGERTGMS